MASSIKVPRIESIAVDFEQSWVIVLFFHISTLLTKKEKYQKKERTATMFHLDFEGLPHFLWVNSSNFRGPR